MKDDCQNIAKARRGVDCPQAKLTPDDVVLIRELVTIREEARRTVAALTNAKIADKFNVASSTIDKVVNGDSWGHV